MEELKAPTFVKKEHSVRKYWSDEGQTLGTRNTHNVGSTTDTVPKTEDWEYKLVVDKYLEMYKTYKDGTKSWAENKGKWYYLVLQHCSPELKTELKNSAWWEEAATNTDIVALLLIIRDVMHNKKERAHNTMGLVENDVAMFTMPMESNDTLDDYYGVFKAQVDTIKAHGNNPGYHGVVYHEHYKVITVSKGYDTKEKLDAVEDVDIKRMKSEAMKSSTGAYLRYLFLIMADGRYMPVNMFLHEVFLAEKQQYPRNATCCP